MIGAVRKTFQCNSNFTEEEFSRLSLLAEERGVPVGRLVRDLALDAIRGKVTTGEQVILRSVEELKYVYTETMRSLADNQFNAARFDEVLQEAEQSRGALALAQLADS